MGEVVIYCDGASDELAAELFLLQGSLQTATIRRLPQRKQAPPFLQPLLAWERLDWVVAIDDKVRCTVELSRHGYTGDNGFQRFARLYRSASLGIPTIYFTPFARTRLNELDVGRVSARNVAPELFETLTELEARFGVACIAVDWPVRADLGQPVPLQDPVARPAMERLGELVGAFSAVPPERSVSTFAEDFPDFAEAMDTHAQIPYRGADTRGAVGLPLNLGDPMWVHEFLPDNYFGTGKADKTLASMALDGCADRSIVDMGGRARWSAESGTAWVQYLGYQWRPDPACGLVALSATKARARELPFIVVWPRVFSVKGETRTRMLRALVRYKEAGDGPLAEEMIKQGRGSQVGAFRERVATDPDQFGVFSDTSKIGRIVRETADALVLGDRVLAYS